jgi:subtilisin family serine protease
MVLHIGADVAPETVQSVATRLGLTQVGYQRFDLVGRGLYRFRINDGRSVPDVIRAMEAEKITATAQPNYVFHLQQDLNAARRNTPAATQGYQYILAKWRLPDVHRVATGRGVLVAMIDSEVDQRHPDIAGAIADRLEPIGQEFKPQPHGTGMAGAMASHRRLIGVAPNARILAVNAFGTDSDSAYGTTEQILKGIDWAIAKGAKVINMSFAGPRDPLVQLALKKAYEKGIVLVAAAGNAGPNSEPLFPAADPDVIAVTATDVNDALLQQANRGAHISVAAPGVDVLVPAPNAQYQLTTGTSVAAAEVSGVIALMLERRPDADPDSIRRALQSTAKDLGTRGRDDDFGWGLVDPYLAMLALDNPSLANARPPAPVPQQ